MIEQSDRKDQLPLPRISDVIDSLDGNMFFSNIDCILVYFQMALDEDSQNLRAFITLLCVFKLEKLPMGFASAPGLFQNLMELKLSCLSYEITLCT